MSVMPVDLATLGSFSIAVIALVMSPGPDTLIIIRHTINSGRSVGLAAVAGVQVGLVLHTLLAIGGISLIIASSPVLFNLVAIAGAAYLAWLGIQGFRGGGAIRINETGDKVGAARALREAALCNLLNPKVILLYLALLPNFIHTERDDVSLQLATLGATLIAFNIIWQAPIAWAGDVIRRWLASERIQRIVSRLTGSILLFFAALMLYENLT